MAVRAVIKVGTSSVTTERGELDLAALSKLADELAAARGAGHELVLVLSGAIAAGLPALGFETRPTDIRTLQAIAAVGQPLLVERLRGLLAAHAIVPFHGQGLNCGFEDCVRMEALLTGTGDWEWSYLLKPRQVRIDAPDWTVVGVRPDGVPKVTGRAQYGADWNLPGMLWGKVLRSPHAHARIRKIDMKTNTVTTVAGNGEKETRQNLPPAMSMKSSPVALYTSM